MNIKRSPILFLITLFAAISLACAGLSAAPTATPEPTAASTNTPEPPPTATATQKPTSTPRPTATAIPPTATPAPVGVTVSNEDYDVNVVKVRKLGSVYLDQNYVWQANPGYLFLELGVQITSKKMGSKSIPWQNIYVIEQDGNSWYPGWGGFQIARSGETVNTATIIFAPINDGTELVQFGDTVFLRVIWNITDNNPSTVNFGFDTSPLIEVVID
jgi:hypothetical protein